MRPTDIRQTLAQVCELLARKLREAGPAQLPSKQWVGSSNLPRDAINIKTELLIHFNRNSFMLSSRPERAAFL